MTAKFGLDYSRLSTELLSTGSGWDIQYRLKDVP